MAGYRGVGREPQGSGRRITQSAPRGSRCHPHGIRPRLPIYRSALHEYRDGRASTPHAFKRPRAVAETEQWRCRDQKEIEGARAELDRNPVGEQLPLAQQHAETPEFESRVGGSRARPVCVVRVSIRQYFRAIALVRGPGAGRGSPGRLTLDLDLAVTNRHRNFSFNVLRRPFEPGE